MASREIQAAGAVVVRNNGGNREYLLIHREYRKDWSFPKGKLDPGEHVLAAAIREVREETGFAIKLGPMLPTQHYIKNTSPKIVNYWLAEVLEGTFVPNDEVDEIRWLSFKDAKKFLSYDQDRELLEQAHVTELSVPLIIMRHTQAMKRTDFANDKDLTAVQDAGRPLTAVGRMQASAVVPALAAYGISRLHTSDSRRCRDTLSPYASARSLALELERTISEERHKAKPQQAHARIVELALTNVPLAICTHRPVMPTVMKAIEETLDFGDLSMKALDPALTPGSFVVIHRDLEDLRKVVGIERHNH